MARRYVNPNRGDVTVTPAQLAEIRAALRELTADVERTTEAIPVTGNHPPMSGSHSHPHSAYGHGDDDDHEHRHDHENDADHHHSHDPGDDGAAAAMRPRRIENRSAEARAWPMKCRIRNEDGGVTRIDIYDAIGEDGFSEGLSAKSFSAQLAKVRGRLDVHINSAGGAVDDGLAIGSNIRGYKGFKRTVVDGIAASIASVIAQAGDERIVEPGSMTFVHDPLTLCYGNASEMAKTVEVLDKHGDNLASIYAERSGGTVDQWREIMQAETWFTAEEAVAAGLADKIGSGSAELPAGLDLAAFHAVPGRIAARLRTMPRRPAGTGRQDQQTLRQIRTAFREAFPR